LPIGVRITIIAGRLSPFTSIEIPALTALLPSQSDDTIASIQTAMDSLVTGVGDGCVSLPSSKLAGVTDYHIVQANHISMINRVTPGKDLPPAIPIILKTLAKQ